MKYKAISTNYDFHFTISFNLYHFNIKVYKYDQLDLENRLLIPILFLWIILEY